MTWPIPNQLSASRIAILTEAVAWIGVAELRDRPNRGPVKRGRGVDAVQPPYIVASNRKAPPWCASFVSHVWQRALGREVWKPIIRAADRIKDHARSKQRWYDAGSALPVPGDAFVLLHAVDTPAFNKGHTGLVYRVSEDGKWIETIEGNARNAVRVIKRPVQGSGAVNQILGFASPLALGDSGYELGLTGRAESPGGSTR